jgi:hypothetical protein
VKYGHFIWTGDIRMETQVSAGTRNQIRACATPLLESTWHAKISKDCGVTASDKTRKLRWVSHSPTPTFTPINAKTSPSRGRSFPDENLNPSVERLVFGGIPGHNRPRLPIPVGFDHVGCDFLVGVDQVVVDFLCQ